jgi:hypothetical protein
MHIGALLLGCAAFVGLGLPPLLANLMFASILVLGVVALLSLETKSQPQ